MALNLVNLAALISKRTGIPVTPDEIAYELPPTPRQIVDGVLGENEYCCERCGGFFEAPEYTSHCPECEAATR